MPKQKRRRSKAVRRRPNRIAKGQLGARRKLEALARTKGFPPKYTALLSYLLGIPEKQTWAFPMIVDVVIVPGFVLAVVEDKHEQYEAVVGNDVAVQAALQKILEQANLTQAEYEWFIGQAESLITIEPHPTRR